MPSGSTHMTARRSRSDGRRTRTCSASVRRARSLRAPAGTNRLQAPHQYRLHPRRLATTEPQAPTLACGLWALAPPERATPGLDAPIYQPPPPCLCEGLGVGVGGVKLGVGPADGEELELPVVGLVGVDAA